MAAPFKVLSLPHWEDPKLPLPSLPADPSSGLSFSREMCARQEGRCRRRRMTRVLGLQTWAQGGAVDYFERDIVQYGSRYFRPDRFPRLRRSTAKQRDLDARAWMEGLHQRLADLAGQQPKGDEHAEEPAGPRSNPEAATPEQTAHFELLMNAGRLEEALEFVRTSLQSGSMKGSRGLDHGSFLRAGIEVGNVELVFEYAGLFPACSDTYNLMMALMHVAGHPEGVQLALDTARRRGLAADLDALGILACAHLEAGDRKGASAAYEEAITTGQLPTSIVLDAFLDACGSPRLS